MGSEMCIRDSGNRLTALLALRSGYPNDNQNREDVFGVMEKGDIRTKIGCLAALNNLTESDGDEENLARVLSALGSVASLVAAPDLHPGLELLSKTTSDPAETLTDSFADQPTERAILLEALGEYQNSPTRVGDSAV